MAKELLFTIGRGAFRMEFFRSGGKGGQNQNKVSSGVRIVHMESGAVGEARDERDQIQNRRLAFTRLCESNTFQRWLRVKVAEHDNRQTAEQWVDEQMRPEHITAEAQEDGRWVPMAKGAGE